MSSSPPANSRDQQFCLRWNNYQSNLTQVFNQLFQTESFVDVTLACEGHSVKAHRLVLSACSPYFLTVLTETPCSHPVIILQGVKWSELKAVVEFMYKGEINICQEQLASLLRVAESLKIRGLADVGGEEAEAVLTSPSESPRGPSQFWLEDTPRKRRRLSEEPRSRSRSRSPSPRSHTPQTPTSVVETLDPLIDLPGSLSRGSSSASNPPPSLPSPSPVASLASSLSSLAHLHGPMPPPGPPLPPHLAHLPPLSPLSPLLNMHPMPRHHSPEDFEIRPGIAEMIREEERRRRDFPDVAKLLESTHHWIGNPMADSYQAQVQAAWQKSWNQTQSLLQNLRFRERGPLKSWRPETMAEAIHAVLKEGLSLSQAARKYDIPYPTFVLYANRVHNLLGPSHEPGDLRPKGRGRPQRILLGAWPEDQIKGVIRAVVFRDTTVFRDGDHKENKKPATPQIKDEAAAATAAATAAASAVAVSQSNSNGPITPNSTSLTPSGTPDKSGNSTPIPPSTPGTSQSLLPGNPAVPSATPPVPGVAIPLPSPLSKETRRVSPSDEFRAGNIPSTVSTPSPNSLSSASTSGTQSLTTATSSIATGPHTPQSRPSSVTSNGSINGPHQNGPSIAISHSSANGQSSTSSDNMNGMVLPSLSSPASTNGAAPLVPSCSQAQSPLTQQPKTPQISPPIQHQFKGQQQQQSSQHSHFNHQSPLYNNSHLQQRNPHFPHHNHQHPSRHQQNPLGPMAGPQQMLGLIAGGLSPSLGNPSAHMARLFGEGPPPMHTRPPQPPINAFHPGFPRPAHPGMQPMPMHNPMNAMGPRMNMDDQDPSPEAILFGKVTSTDRQIFNQIGPDIGSGGGRQIASNPFDSSTDTTNTIDRPMMFRDALDTIKSEPEAIMN